MSALGIVLGVLGALGTCVCAAIGFAVVAVLAWWAFTPAEYEVRTAEDRKDPKKAWVQGVGLLLMDDGDYAYMSDGSIQVMLEDAWGITDRDGLESTLAGLEARTEERAWNVARAFLLLRSAVAMGWLDNPTSWARCLALGVKLQDAYRSWDEMAEDLLRSRRRWREVPEDGSDDSEDMEAVVERVADMKRGHWKTVSWAAALE